MATTRFPNGLTDRASTHPFGDLAVPDQGKTHEYFDDFNYFDSGQWNSSQVGSAQNHITGGPPGGLVGLQIGATNNDYFQMVGEEDVLSTRVKTFIGMRLANAALDAFNNSEWLVGIAQGGQVIMNFPSTNVRDGLFFRVFNGLASIVIYETDVIIFSADDIFDLSQFGVQEYFSVEMVWDPEPNQLLFGLNANVLGTIQADSSVRGLVDLTLFLGAGNRNGANFTMGCDYMYASNTREAQQFSP